jgi:hypothetical protein
MFFGGINGCQQTDRRQRTLGRGEKAHQLKKSAHEDIDQAQQEGRAVLGGEEEREEIQGRQAEK